MAGKHTHTRTSVHTLMVSGQCPALAFLSGTAECTSRFSRLCTPSRRAASHYLNQVFSRFISPSCLNAQVSTSKDLSCYPFKGREKKTHFYFYFSFTLNYFVCAATSVFRKRKKPATCWMVLIIPCWPLAQVSGASAELYWNHLQASVRS